MAENISEKPGRVYIPTRTYDLQVKIKELDYTNDLVSARIASSLTTGYQIIELILELDPDDIIVDNLFGEDPIVLSVTLLRETQELGPRTDFNLMYLKSDFQLSERDVMGGVTQKIRSMYIVTTVTRAPYKTLTSLVNDVFIGATPKQVIESLVDDTDAKLTYDIDGENTTIIDQVCIPPTTLYSVIKEYDRQSEDMFDGFLDQRFGLFHGTPGVFCQYNNEIFVKNLTSRMSKAQAFTIYLLADGQDKETEDRVFAEVNDAQNAYYTYDVIDTDYSGNARFAVIASDLNHIVKPKNTLFAVINQDLKTVGKDFSLIYRSQNTTRTRNIISTDINVDRKRYISNDTGYETENTLFNTRYGRTLADLSSISFNVERNLPILPLLQVGECVKFRPFIVEYQSLQGKYILWSSLIKFSRVGDWEATCRVNLVRTNKLN